LDISRLRCGEGFGEIRGDTGIFPRPHAVTEGGEFSSYPGGSGLGGDRDDLASVPADAPRSLPGHRCRCWAGLRSHERTVRVKDIATAVTNDIVITTPQDGRRGHPPRHPRQHRSASPPRCWCQRRADHWWQQLAS